MAGALVALTMTMPAMAQVASKTGQSACPAGVTERNTSAASFSVTLGHSDGTAATFGITNLKRPTLRGLLTGLGHSNVANLNNDFPVTLQVNGAAGVRVGDADFGTVSQLFIENQTRTLSTLSPGERYSASLVTRGITFVTRCFQTAVPAVNWHGISDGTGSSSCPAGHMEMNTQVTTIVSGSLKSKSVSIMTPLLSVGNIKTYTGRSFSFAQVSLEVLGPNGQRVGNQRVLGTAVGGQSIPAVTKTFTGLKPSTRYVVRARTPSTPFASRCFRTPADLNRGLQWHEDLQLHAGGCFAGGLTREEIRACLCGARNRAGQWARKGTVEPIGSSVDPRLANDTIYKWILSASERTRMGCTTN